MKVVYRWRELLVQLAALGFCFTWISTSFTLLTEFRWRPSRRSHKRDSQLYTAAQTPLNEAVIATGILTPMNTSFHSLTSISLSFSLSLALTKTPRKYVRKHHPSLAHRSRSPPLRRIIRSALRLPRLQRRLQDPTRQRLDLQVLPSGRDVLHKWRHFTIRSEDPSRNSSPLPSPLADLV